MFSPYTTYLKFCLVLFSSLILSVAIFNWIIDPFGKYQIITIANFNAEKTQVEIIGLRTLKAIGLLNADYHTVILGTSRAHNGINPKHAVFEAIGPTYNVSLNGTNIYELDQIFTFILKQHPNLREVVFSLDFLTFSNRRTVGPDFDQSLFSDNYSVWTKLSQTFSLDEGYYSIQTILDNVADKRAAYHAIITEQGFAKRQFPLPHSQLFKNILSNNFFVNKYTYAAFCYSQDRLHRFQNILEKARQRGILVRLFISPIHAWQQEAIRMMGLYPTFEQWKRDLTTILAKKTVNSPASPTYLLWDFTGYNQITTETIPTLPHQKMQWYWESSHFKKELGDLVLEKLFNYHSQPIIPAGFGVLINAQNIEAHLIQLREQQQHYHQSHPQDIAKIEALAAQTMRKVDLPCP